MCDLAAPLKLSNLDVIIYMVGKIANVYHLVYFVGCNIPAKFQ